jgi:hypothetical protein
MNVNTFRNSALHSDYYQRIGINFVVALPLRIDEVNVISVVFADFEDHERAGCRSSAARRDLPKSGGPRGSRCRPEAHQPARSRRRLADDACDFGWPNLGRFAGGTAAVEPVFPGIRIRTPGKPASALLAWFASVATGAWSGWRSTRVSTSLGRIWAAG